MTMSPKEYLDRYGKIVFRHPLNGSQVQTRLTGYGSGWGPEKGCNRKTIGPKAQNERAALARAILRHLSPDKKIKSLPKFFRFNERPLGEIPDTEWFYPISLINVFVGKGSPDEITDTLRLAIGLNRIGQGRDVAGQPVGASTVEEYMERYMTLDCNGLVGNYYGLNKIANISIQNYAVPSRARKKITDVKQGDCIITHYTGGPYHHIALVEKWDIKSKSGKDDGGTALVEIVEWGEAGGEDKHYSSGSVEVKRGKEASWGVSFEGKSGKSRYIFSPPPSFKAHNGWADME